MAGGRPQEPELGQRLGLQTAAKLRQLGAAKEQVTSYVNSDGVAVRTIAYSKITG